MLGGNIVTVSSSRWHLSFSYIFWSSFIACMLEELMFSWIPHGIQLNPSWVPALKQLYKAIAVTMSHRTWLYRICNNIWTCEKSLRGLLLNSYTVKIKKLDFCFYFVCLLSKTPCKKGKQQISNWWSKQLTQIPFIKPRQAQS